MKKKKFFLMIILIMGTFMTGGCMKTSEDKLAKEAVQTENKKNEISSMPEEVIQEVEIQDEISETEEEKTEVYVDYSKDLYNQMIGKEPFVLFFYAPWCPTCRRLEKEILAEINEFPAGTKILKADYDTETDLKEKYGIRLQSSFVVLDASGKNIATLYDPSMKELRKAISR